MQFLHLRFPDVSATGCRIKLHTIICKNAFQFSGVNIWNTGVAVHLKKLVFQINSMSFDSISH